MRKLFTAVPVLIMLITILPGLLSAEGLVVDPDGNVGIGTASSPQPLTVKGADSGIRVESDSTDRPWITLVNGSTEMLKFSANGTYGAIGDGVSINRYMVFKSGNIGVGKTSPSYKLDVNGKILGENVSASDVRLKSNIRTIEDSLEKITQLRGVTYEWTDSAKGVGEQIGVIAQEVEKIFPQVVSIDNQGYKSVAYAKLVSPLIESVKILKKENDSQKQIIETLKRQNELLKQNDKRIEHEIAQLKLMIGTSNSKK
ncbi:MAG: tail fiber domain-containing protein [Desulfobacterales bacterium]|nr:tail fiber domain-containing protein [Desulfobacterales bacterium]